MKTKDKEEILNHIDKIKQGVKDELKNFEKDNAKALDGFTQKEKVLILYYMLSELEHKIRGLNKNITVLYWLFVFVNVELILISIFGH